MQGSKIAKGLQNFQVLVNWDYFYEKKIFKKSHNVEKIESEDPLGFFNIHSVAKLQKKLKRRTLWDFLTSILLQNSKKTEGEPFVMKNFF